MPVFNAPYASYQPAIIEPFLQPGVPYIHGSQATLASILMSRSPEYLLPPLVDKKEFAEFPGLIVGPRRGLCFKFILAQDLGEPLAQILHDINRNLLPGSTPQCIMCFSMYAHPFLDTSIFRSVPIVDAPYCERLKSFVTQVASKQCIFSDAFLGSSENLNDTVKGLKVYYSREIPLKDYLEIIDGKTTRAVRDAMRHILEDPLTRKYRQRLSSKIYEFNRDVEELSRSRLSKLGVCATDILCYNLKRFVPIETARKAVDWLANATLALQAKLMRRDWAVLQLYIARRRLEQPTRKTALPERASETPQPLGPSFKKA